MVRRRTSNCKPKLNRARWISIRDACRTSRRSGRTGLEANPRWDIAHVSRSGKGAIAVRRAQIALGKHPFDHAGGTRVRKPRGSSGKAKAPEAAGAGSAAAIAAARIPIALWLASERRNRRARIAAASCLTIVAYRNARGEGSEREQPLHHLAAIGSHGHATRPSIELSIVHEPSF